MPLPQTAFTFSAADGSFRRCWVEITDECVPHANPIEGLGRCGGCGQSGPEETPAEIVLWCGMRWIGTPLPKRYLLRWFFRDVPRDWIGCGCILKLKALRLVISRIMALSRLHLRAWRET